MQRRNVHALLWAVICLGCLSVIVWLVWTAGG